MLNFGCCFLVKVKFKLKQFAKPLVYYQKLGTGVCVKYCHHKSKKQSLKFLLGFSTVVFYFLVLFREVALFSFLGNFNHCNCLSFAPRQSLHLLREPIGVCPCYSIRSFYLCLLFSVLEIPACPLLLDTKGMNNLDKSYLSTLGWRNACSV